MTSYAYISGTSGTDATITFDGVLGAPTAYNNLGSGPNSYKTIGFLDITRVNLIFFIVRNLN